MKIVPTQFFWKILTSMKSTEQLNNHTAHTHFKKPLTYSTPTEINPLVCAATCPADSTGGYMQNKVKQVV